MDKKEFLAICDSVLKEMGFVKKNRAYYLQTGSDLVGAIFLHGSSYGGAYYVNCGITIQGYDPSFPFPNHYDTAIQTRLPFPLKQRLAYNPAAALRYSVDLERNTESEIRDYLRKGIEDWLLPALEGGKTYLLDHWEKYQAFPFSEEVHAALLNWKATGRMPQKPDRQENG